ncbi:MAG: CvpA family protein [Atribacterota bacterium]|nr:CvpA family protein [Atribacterota bacterium]
MIINWVDLIILVIVLFNVFLGFKRGVIAELLTLIGLISAIFVSIFWYHDLSVFLIKQFKWNEALSNIISFIIIFLLVIFCFRILETLLNRIVDMLFLSWINNLGGVLFGFLRGAIIASLLLFLVNFIPLPLEIRIQLSDSVLAKYLLDGLIVIYNSLHEWLPEHFQFEAEILRENLFKNIGV